MLFKTIKKTISMVCIICILLASFCTSSFASPIDNDDISTYERNSVNEENSAANRDVCPYDPVLERSFGYIPEENESDDALNVTNNANKVLRNRTESLPSSVDNSTSPYFPAIGNQGSVGSCTSFATAYYQYTYEINKRDQVVTTTDNTCCPQFPYSYICYGRDVGTSFPENYDALSKFGCLRYGDYAPTDIDLSTEFFQFWNGNESARFEAIKDKAVAHVISLGTEDSIVTFGTNSDTDYTLDTAKQLLNDGHLLAFGCNFNYESMQISNAGTHSGETIIVRGTNNGYYGHAITIVGYDDEVCVDVNADGIIEPAECGAFKIANSWGDDWENDGYIWLLYDACNKVSQNSSSTWEQSFNTTRIGFVQSNKLYYIEVEQRNAKLLGVVNMVTGDRYKTRVSHCSCDSYGHGTNYSYYLWPYAGQPILPFEGSLVFCLDSELDAMPCFPGEPFNMIIGTDNIGPYETMINYVRIIDDKGIVIISDTDPDAYIDIYNVYNNEYTRDNDFTLEFALGDINYDWSIGPIDSMLMISYLLGNRDFSSMQYFLADINGDGSVTSLDSNLLTSLIAGS